MIKGLLPIDSYHLTGLFLIELDCENTHRLFKNNQRKKTTQRTGFNIISKNAYHHDNGNNPAIKVNTNNVNK
jgi:hypothetical protein